MPDDTPATSQTQTGYPAAAEQLLPRIYDELRRLAAQKLAHEQPGQTLQPTALVHEAYLRLAGDQAFENRGHFFAAAAEAMRRILIDHARRKGAVKHGGGGRRVSLDEELSLAEESSGDDLLALDVALSELELYDEPAARLVKLRYFAGLSHQQAADALGITRRAADRLWALARVWLHRRLEES